MVHLTKHMKMEFQLRMMLHYQPVLMKVIYRLTMMQVLQHSMMIIEMMITLHQMMKLLLPTKTVGVETMEVVVETTT